MARLIVKNELNVGEKVQILLCSVVNNFCQIPPPTDPPH